jgi:hypothetical protein
MLHLTNCIQAMSDQLAQRSAVTRRREAVIQWVLQASFQTWTG